MPRKPLITDKDKSYIAMAYHNNLDGNAVTIKKTASLLAGRDLGLSTVQRELAHLREKHREVPSDDEKNQDQPWTIGTIGKYPVSNDFVPHLIHIKKIWEYQKGSPLTIRQALWCDKLKGFPLKDEKRLEDLTETQLIEWGTLLVRNAAWYAELERWGMIGNYQVDTSMYDDKSLSEIWNNITEYTDILRNNRRNGANNG